MLTLDYIVNSLFTSRTYILSREDCFDVWLVDCGDVERLPVDVRVAGVLLTHAHFDHIYGLNRLVERFPEVRVVTNGCGFETLADAKRNMSRYHENPIVVRPEHAVVCRDGDEVELWDGVKAVAHETPGHHPSCLCFKVDGWLFTGDAYIPGCKVVTNLPEGDKGLAAASEQKIRTMVENEGLVVCAGHEV